ncbi:MAG: YidC/Oxa1 family membrane protein insertase, partial [Clostridia bacterium]|nr:YidC/Oxa1 family membrane protein insertase [Clostridia bacterium]
MAFLSNLFASAVAEPSGLWEWLILNVFNFISNYGWRVLFFTLCLKLLLSPLDIFQRYKARKNQKITEKLKPEIEKLKKQYPDPQVFQQKQAMLQKQSGISYFSSCLPAIATLVIFITLLNGLNNISAYMNFIEYKSYYDLYNETKVEYLATNPGDETGAVEAGQQAVYDYYQDNRTGWLWVKNIWSPDVPWASEINSKDTFITNIRDYGTSTSMSGLTTEEIANMKTEYNNVMGKLLNSSENQS